MYLISFLSWFSGRTSYFRNSRERHNRRSRTGRSWISFLTFISLQSFESKTHVTFLSFRTWYAGGALELYIILHYIYKFEQTLQTNLNDTYIRTSFTLWANWASISLQTRWTGGSSYTVHTRFTFLSDGERTGIRWLTLFSFRTGNSSKTTRSRFSGNTVTSGSTLKHILQA